MRIGHLLSVVLVCLLLVGGCATPGADQTTPWVDLAEINEKIVKAKEQRTSLDLPPQEMEPEIDQSRSRELSVEKDGQNPRLTKIIKKRPLRERARQLEEDEGGILLNFDNADIYEVIRVVAETLEMNYIIDPQVKGVVNIRSGSQIPREKLYEVFKKILNINGLDIISEGEYYYIHVAPNPSAEGIYCPDQMEKLEDSSRMVMQIVPLLSLKSTEAEKLILPYLSDQGTIYNLVEQNTIIINDFESKVIDALAILAKLDISPLAAFNLRLVRVENAPLFELYDELTEILKSMNVGVESLSLVPLERVNSLLLVSKSEYLLDNVDKWISELDVTPAAGSADNIYFYNVRNSVASELVELVNALIGAEEDTLGRRREANQRGLGVQPGEGTGGTPVRPRPVVSQAGERDSGGLQFAGGPMLIADDTRNLVLIRALASDYKRLLKLLERLDNLPQQVLIEVLVAEVTLSDSWSFGVEWALKSHNLSINGTDYTQNFSTNFEGLVRDTVGGFTYSLIKSNDDIRALLNAIASDTAVSILSSPQILVLNNETASVNVGDQVPIITTEVVREGGTGDALNRTVQYRDTGVILSVKPRINYNGIIILEIDQQVSNAASNTLSGISSPIISTRQLQTKLAVKDGQSILMGGLIEKNTTNNESGVPLLKEIPGLGWLFKSHSENSSKTELLVMITPYVIDTEEVMEQYFRLFREKMQGLRQEISERPDETTSESAL